MDNRTVQLGGKLNSNGDLIVDTREDGGNIINTIKYGIIKLRGDTTEYRVSYKTLVEITTKPEKFNGHIVISELHLKVPINDIVFQQFRDEELTTPKDFTRLPTRYVICENTEIGENFKPTNLAQWQVDKMKTNFWLTRLHFYISPNDEPLYDCNFSHAKEALYMRALEDKDYPAVINRIFRYGVEQLFERN